MWGNFFPKHSAKKQIKDSGMAFTLLFLLLGYFSNRLFFYKIALPVLLINMIYFSLYLALAIVWLGLSKLLGIIVSNILLLVIFYIVVTPVGILRKILGYYSLRLKEWKNGETSVFIIRDFVFTKEDLENPF